MKLRIILFASFVVSAISSPVPYKHYRLDYEYNKNTDAFYKLHTEGAREMFASEKCIEEGAELVKITSDEDLKQIHALMKKFLDLEDSVLVASDVNSDYDSTNGDKCNVVNSKGEIDTETAFNDRPFVCKVAARDTLYNEECGVYSNDYESKISTTGSCYRVSTVKATWDEAHANCQAEGAHLVILSNDEELKVLYNMLKDKPHDSETLYFAGVRADTTTEPRVFKTVLNETLEEVGYGPWEEDEPNNYHGGENCVALDTRRHGKYNDVWCHAKMPYVCERSGAPLDIRRPPPSTPNGGIQMSAVPVPSKEYRLDYEYNKNTDAFYKLHTEGAREMSASRKCIEEGAELVKITSDGDVKQIQAMMKKFPALEDSVLVASHVNSIYSSRNNYECNVVNRKGEIETTSAYKKLPFVCKVAARDAPYSEECGVYSNDYESSISTTGSCYRVSTVEATWDEAHASCQAEGAHLVILRDAEELEVIYNMLKDKPHGSETLYFAGVRADMTTEPRVFKTVLNQTLEEVGYGPWEEDEPNNYHGGENCVALDTRRHGKYNDVWCHAKMPYVCESAGLPLDIQPSPSTPNGGIQMSDSVSSPDPSKQYRPGYEYNENTDAFYKLHTEDARIMYASKKCIEEGGEIVKITSDEDLKQIQALMKKFSDLEDYEYVMVASDLYQELPFVCKVAVRHATYNKECGVYSNDYEPSISTTGSCYRVSTVEATWDEAHANCQAEGAHLVILSNDEELDFLYNMLKSKPHDSETQYFAGVRADTTLEPRVFKTVLNKTLEELGYGPWEEDEPNSYGFGENCVALDTRRHGKYNDVWCHVKMLYVCESSGAPLDIRPSPSTPKSSIIQNELSFGANVMQTLYFFFAPNYLRIGGF